MAAMFGNDILWIEQQTLAFVVFPLLDLCVLDASIIIYLATAGLIPDDMSATDTFPTADRLFKIFVCII